MAEDTLDAKRLRKILEKLGEPGSLADDPFLQSWIVQDYIDANPDATEYPAEFLIGMALERQIERWSQGLALRAHFKDDWVKIFCLKGRYFRKMPGLRAYGEHLTYRMLGRVLGDPTQLAALVPGREAEAKALLEAEEYKPFWEAFDRDGLAANRAAEKLDQAIQAFVEHLERWQAHAMAQSAAIPLPAADSEIGSTQTLDSQPGHRIEETASAATRPDPIDLYLTQALPPPPTFMPEEWREIISAVLSSSRAFVQGSVGGGLTTFLYATAHELRLAGAVPIYVRLPDYAPFASEIDLLRFVATHGDFGRAYRDESTRNDFEQALAEAERTGRLVILADDSNRLLEREIANITDRLRDFQRLVVAERSPCLPLERTKAITVLLPTLSDRTLVALLAKMGISPDPAMALIMDLKQAGLVDNLDVTFHAARRFATDIARPHLVQIVTGWANDRLRQTRLPDQAEGIDDAHRLLRELAAIQLGILSGPAKPLGIPGQDARSVAERITRDGSAWLDFCARAGLLLNAEGRWHFAQPGLAYLYAAEYVADEQLRLSISTRHRQAMLWAAARLARRGEDYRNRRFFDAVMTASRGATDLALLDIADLVAEFTGFETSAVTEVRARMVAALKDLARIESNRLRQAVQHRAKRLGGDAGLSGFDGRLEEVLSPDTIDLYAQDLAALLEDLGVESRGTAEGDWLADSRVIFGLIDGLRDLNPGERLIRIAAWLRRALHAKADIVQGRGLVKSQRITAAEAVAQIAITPDPTSARSTLARSALTSQGCLSELLRHGETYEALVYTILLAIDQRLVFREHLQTWEFVA